MRRKGRRTACEFREEGIGLRNSGGEGLSENWLELLVNVDYIKDQVQNALQQEDLRLSSQQGMGRASF